MKISKKALLEQSKVALLENLDLVKRASEEAKLAAIHEESKAEDQYDTRGLEASYLAVAQEARVQSILSAVKTLEDLFFRIEEKSSLIKVGSLVLLEEGSLKKWYFLLPISISKTLLLEQQEVYVISFQSPLAKILVGKTVGDSFIFETKKEEKEFSILEIY